MGFQPDFDQSDHFITTKLISLYNFHWLATLYITGWEVHKFCHWCDIAEFSQVHDYDLFKSHADENDDFP